MSDAVSYAAKLDEDSNVTDVIVVPESLDDDASIQKFCKELGLDGVWILTKIDGSYRGVFAGSGHYYDADADVFVPPITV